MAQKRTDIFGVEPEIGDLIAFNPAHYKGLCVSRCVGFSQSGLPEVEADKNSNYGFLNNNLNYTPKTGFVVHKQ